MPLKGFFRDDGGGSGRRDSGKPDKLDKMVTKAVRALLPPGMKRDRASNADRAFFNPEEYISEKRAWSRRYTAGGAPHSADARPDRLFEHFAVVGLPPTTNIRAVAADIKTYQRLSREGGGAAGMHVTADTPREERQRQYGLKGPALAAEVLHTFPPPGMPADLRDSLAAFCFPHGVRPELLERTPSMSALNEVIYSQPYQTHDDHSFVFLMKVSDPSSVAPRTLYGVCCYVRELVHRPPSLAREAFPGCTAPLRRYLVVARRCYCLLTHHPFFALHFRVLQTILGLERLERMTSFAAEIAGPEAGGAGASPHAAPSLPASSAGGPASTATSLSMGQGEGGDGRLPAATGTAGACGDDGDGDGSEGSSRRWTDGSSAAGDPLAQQAGAPPGLEQYQQQQYQQRQEGDDVAVMLRQLELGAAAQPPRPSRMSQVSPHCPAQPPDWAANPGDAAAQRGSAAATLQAPPPPTPAAGEDADGDCGGYATPPERALLAGDAAATPFFTPAGLSSAVASPAARLTQQLEALVEGGAQMPAPAMGEGGGGDLVRRVLHSLDLQGDGSMVSEDAAAPRVGAPGSEPRAAAAGQLVPTSMAAAGQHPRSTAGGDGAADRPGSGQRAAMSGDDEAASEADSFLTAGSSAALLGPEGSPTAGERRAGHKRSASGASLGGVSAAGGSPSVPAASSGTQQQREEQAATVPQQCETPLVDVGPDAFPAARANSDELMGRQRLPPLDLGAVPPLPAEQPEQREEQQVPEQQQEPEQQGSGVEVRVVTRSFSSCCLASAAAAAPSASLPRDDVLAGPPGGGRSSRHLGQRLGAGSWHEQQRGGGGETAGAGRQAAAPTSGTQQEQERQQGGEVEVVRVTATNLDMSRPLRSADLLQVYRASVVPRPGQASVFEFQPDPGLQTIAFERPDPAEAAADLGLRPDASTLPDIDAAANLGGWAVAALCRSMSLDSVLTFLTAALLERQIVVFCPNVGLLSGVVLSLVPLLLPFHWQCLLLPVLPAAQGRLELMEAPVPFVLGVLYKTAEVRAKCGGLVRVNVYKDKVKNAGGLPPLPQQAALHDALAGTYSELRKIGLTRAAATRPVHLISDAQQVLAECLLSTLQKYLKGLMADLRAYCITDVSASMERTSVLLKDSFIDSFPPRDRPFMRLFAETQMFAVYTDSALA